MWKSRPITSLQMKERIILQNDNIKPHHSQKISTPASMLEYLFFIDNTNDNHYH